MTPEPSPQPIPTDLRICGLGLILREWHDDDLPAMVTLFDDSAVDRFTPLRSPFDLQAARAYLTRARQRRAEGRVQLAITTDGQQPLGEILLFPTDTGPTDAELAYAVGPQHRRQRLATRAVQLISTHARTHLGVHNVILRIAAQNTASSAVARAAGFHLTATPPTTREGAQDPLHTWQHTR
ncbi:GNAT family N-acetyltransferase [Actinacidiphila glaucinigra]|uniref:GNAT family N-acetyltransferase n=1 Tax=Actinacidiphila glaucinigra TaxID=235986 RepID=UPI0029B5568F|nr:GNAT family N-acetyltransferase [Streptomyces sp. PA03-3a]